MRMIPPDQLAAVLSRPPGSPRVLAGGNHATPQRPLSVLDATAADNRLFLGVRWRRRIRCRASGCLPGCVRCTQVGESEVDRDRAESADPEFEIQALDSVLSGSHAPAYTRQEVTRRQGAGLGAQEDGPTPPAWPPARSPARMRTELRLRQPHPPRPGDRRRFFATCGLPLRSGTRPSAARHAAATNPPRSRVPDRPGGTPPPAARTSTSYVH